MTGVLHIVLARKPVEGTVAENCLRFGCGAINIDGCRVVTDENRDRAASGGKGNGGCYGDSVTYDSIGNALGRWPANLILGGEEVVTRFPMTTSVKGKSRKAVIKNQTRLNNSKNVFVNCEYNDTGSASRFFFNFDEQESDE